MSKEEIREKNLIEKIDEYIRASYSDDKEKLNGLVCLFKTNIDKIKTIQTIEDFDVKYHQAEGNQEELLKIINSCKKC